MMNDIHYVTVVQQYSKILLFITFLVCHLCGQSDLSMETPKIAPGPPMDRRAKPGGDENLLTTIIYRHRWA